MDNEIYNYRWVVVACATLGSALTWGISNSGGIYYVSWNDYFDAGKGSVAIIAGINSGSTGLLGPVFGLTVQRFGVRLSGAFSGLLLAFGLIGSAFSSSIPLLCVFYGLFAGAGTGLGSFAVCVAVNNYFKRHRSLAEGIVSAGCGIGGFIFSILGKHLTEEYGWQGALMITGAITANIIVVFQLTITPSYLRRFPKLRNWKSVSKHEMDVNKNLPLEEDQYCSLPDSKGRALENNNEDESWFRRCSKLFKNPVFLLIFWSNFICWAGIFVPFIHLPERARLLGMDTNTIAWIASTLNVGSIISRPAIASIPSFFKVDVFYLYGLINGLAGIITILSPLLRTKAGLLAYAALFGMMNVCGSLGRTSMAKLLGSDSYPLAYSWILCSEGVALFVGPALAGYIYDITSSYDYSFYATGSMLLLSGLLTLLKNPAVRMQRRRKTATRDVEEEAASAFIATHKP